MHTALNLLAAQATSVLNNILGFMFQNTSILKTLKQ
jgi:hypothetical protein